MCGWKLNIFSCYWENYLSEITTSVHGSCLMSHDGNNQLECNSFGVLLATKLICMTCAKNLAIAIATHWTINSNTIAT